MAGNEPPARVLRPRPLARAASGTPSQPARRKKATTSPRAKSVPPSTHSASHILECVLLAPRKKARQSTVERETFPEAASSSRTPMHSAAPRTSSARATKLGRLVTTKETSTSKKRRRASTPPHSLLSPEEVLRDTDVTGLLTPAPSQDWQMGRADLDAGFVFESSQRITAETTESATARRTRSRRAGVDIDAGLVANGSQAMPESVASTTRRTRSRASTSGDAADSASAITHRRRASANTGSSPQTNRAKGKGKGRAAARAPDPTATAKADSGPLPDSDGPTARPHKRRRLQDQDRGAAHLNGDTDGDAGVPPPPPPAPVTLHGSGSARHEEHEAMQLRAGIDDVAHADTGSENKDDTNGRDGMDIEASIPGAVGHQAVAPLAGLQVRDEGCTPPPPRQSAATTIPERRSSPPSAPPTPPLGTSQNGSMTLDTEPDFGPRLTSALPRSSAPHGRDSTPEQEPPPLLSDADRAPFVGELLYPSSTPDIDGAAELTLESPLPQSSPPPDCPAEPIQSAAQSELEAGAPAAEIDIAADKNAGDAEHGGHGALDHPLDLNLDLVADEDANDAEDDDDGALDLDLDLSLDADGPSAESDADFQLLELLDAATLSWVRTDLPSAHPNSTPPSDAETETLALYLPPGAHLLVESMKHALRTETAARHRAEARCAHAMRAHLAAEQRVSALEAACAALANEQRLWSDADAASFLRAPEPPSGRRDGAGRVRTGSDERTHTGGDDDNGEGGEGTTPATTPALAPARRAPPVVGEHTQTVLARAAAVQDMLRRWVPLPAGAAQTQTG